MSRASGSMGMVVGVGFGVLVLILIGLAVVFGSRRGGDVVAVTVAAPASEAGVAPVLPPIDVAAPAETEVATFALG